MALVTVIYCQRRDTARLRCRHYSSRLLLQL